MSRRKISKFFIELQRRVKIDGMLEKCKPLLDETRFEIMKMIDNIKKSYRTPQMIAEIKEAGLTTTVRSLRILKENKMISTRRYHNKRIISYTSKGRRLIEYLQNIEEGIIKDIKLEALNL